jgi:hypothetical protein
MDIRHDPHDQRTRITPIADDETLAQRALPWPVHTRHGLAYHDRARAVRPIGVIEDSTRNESNAGSAEVVCRNKNTEVNE